MEPCDNALSTTRTTVNISISSDIALKKKINRSYEYLVIVVLNGEKKNEKKKRRGRLKTTATEKRSEKFIVGLNELNIFCSPAKLRRRLPGPRRQPHTPLSHRRHKTVCHPTERTASRTF